MSKVEERQQAILRAIWTNWTVGRKTGFRELAESMGSKGNPGSVPYYLDPLVEQGYVEKVPLQQGRLGGRDRHFYTRGPRLMGVDKRTGRVGRLIDEDRGWL